MLIDAILDRKDGQEYRPDEFANYVGQFDQWPLYLQVATAVRNGKEDTVKRLLCSYICGEYNLNIIYFILSVNWCK